MQYGDLSNKRGPAIVLNADLLVTLKKKLFGLYTDVEFMLSTRHKLDHWFTYGDLSIYIILSGDYLKQRNKIMDMLDTFGTPYSGVYEVDNPGSLDQVVNQNHVIGYFYSSEFNHTVDERIHKGKFKQVESLQEVDVLLNGGVYTKWTN